jgi:hypothetical protein
LGIEWSHILLKRASSKVSPTDVSHNRPVLSNADNVKVFGLHESPYFEGMTLRIK